MLKAKRDLLLLAHLRQNTHEETHGQCLSGACFTPQGQMGGMIIIQNGSKMPTQLGHFIIADIGVEYLLKHLKLLRMNQLFIIKIASVHNDVMACYVLHFIEQLGLNV